MSEPKKNTRSITTSIGQRIRELRVRRGFTQTVFGRKCFGAAAQGRVSHYENSRREPSIDDIRIMARVLGVSTDELISGQRRRTVEPIVGIPLLAIEFFKKRQGKTRMAKRVLERLPVPAGLAVSDKAFAVKLRSQFGEFGAGEIIICDPKPRAQAHQYVWVTPPDQDLPVVARYGDIGPNVRRDMLLHGVIVAKLKVFD